MTHLAPLPASAVPSSGWQTHAACRGLGDEVFFATDNERGRSLRRRENAAKAVCARCPAVDPCLETALSSGEVYGVWGGLTPAERLGLQPTDERSQPPLSRRASN